MREGQPSRTAFGAAAHRAAHQVAEGGRVFNDPLALAILGADASMASGNLDEPATRSMRMFIAARSRFAEDSLAAAVARGVRQYVVLGAGLDTFAYRNPFAEAGLKVFEVDHPRTQDWKRGQLAYAGLTPPPALTFAPVDFERQTLADGLAAAGFDPAAPAFFSWLGVIVYLTRQAVFTTLRYVADLGGEVVFDYGEPVSSYPLAEQPAHLARLARMALIGEPWVTRFEPAALARDLMALGFGVLEDLGPRQIAERYLGVRRREGPGGHLMRAATS